MAAVNIEFFGLAFYMLILSKVWTHHGVIDPSQLNSKFPNYNYFTYVLNDVDIHACIKECRHWQYGKDKGEFICEIARFSQKMNACIMFFDSFDRCPLDKAGCEHECHRQQIGYACSCPQLYKVWEDGKMCIAKKKHVTPESTNITIDDPAVLEPFPNGYQNYLEREWLIQAVHPHQRLQVRFWKFNIEYSRTCGWDRLYVYDGRNSSAPRKGIYCGTGLPPRFNSTGNSVFLVFISDYVVTRYGFLVEFKTFSDSPCPQWICENGECIEWSGLCDGVEQCSDGSDERAQECQDSS